MKCSCSFGAIPWPIMFLIHRYSTPTNFPSDCVAVFDKKNCKYVVHKKDDPDIPCPIFGGVGWRCVTCPPWHLKWAQFLESKSFCSLIVFLACESFLNIKNESTLSWFIIYISYRAASSVWSVLTNCNEVIPGVCVFRLSAGSLLSLAALGFTPCGLTLFHEPRPCI